MIEKWQKSKFFHGIINWRYNCLTTSFTVFIFLLIKYINYFILLLYFMILVEIFGEIPIFENSKSRKSLESWIFQIFYFQFYSLVFAQLESEDEKYLKLRDEKYSRTTENDIWPEFGKISLSTAKIFKSVIFSNFFSVLDRGNE